MAQTSKVSMPGLLAYSVRIGEALDLQISRELRNRIPGISRAQAEVLLLLERRKNADMSSLARDLQKDPGTMTTVVQALYRKGLLDRNASIENRRTYSVRLKPEGKALARRCLALYRKVEQELQSNLSDSTQILSVLEGFYIQLKQKGYLPYPD